jgi:acetyltransferase-like isoleucine patch superfamily enzyme
MEDATAVALGSILLPGATVRRGSWIGVLSSVAGEIPENSLASGNPAAVVKKIR